jgi:putative nucleotidyltransferase-like protein
LFPPGWLFTFRDAGIETMVLKGAILHYKDCGLRPMNDFDVMVRVGQTSAAIDLMRRLGWNPMPRSPEALTESYLSIVNSHGFTHSAGRECDLHWHLFPECCQADDDNDFWDQSVPFHVHDALTRSLAPTDQLLHVCVHSAEWNPIPPLRWVADAMMIMKTSVINWNRLIAQAQKRRLILPLRDTLDYLHHRLAARVPPEILQSLHNMQASRLERAEYKYKTENYEAKPLGYLPVLWFRYLRLEGSDRPLHKLLGFVKYLQRFWARTMSANCHLMRPLWVSGRFGQLRVRLRDRWLKILSLRRLFMPKLMLVK